MHQLNWHQRSTLVQQVVDTAAFGKMKITGGDIYETFHPGEVEDVEIGPFNSVSEAKRAIEGALTETN